MKISITRPSIGCIGISLFLFAMYSIGTISAMTVSWTFTLILLIIACALFFLAFAKCRATSTSTLIIVWAILTIFCFIGVIRGNSITLLGFYILCLAVLAMSPAISADSLFVSLKWFKFFGLVFSFGCYWQYLFPDQYYTRIYPLFGEEYHQSIRRQFTFHKMCTGFTSQTAVAAGFIILGIMAVLYLYSRRETKKRRMISIIEMIFLIGGLLLTGKRSPILNLGAAIIFVYMLTVKRSKKVNRILAVFLGIVVALTALYFLVPLFSGSRNSIVRLLESLNDLSEAFNGRLSLYGFAISEFIKHPILGIGWGRYSLLYDITGVHNIYLQLLCECGIIGFLLSVFGMIYTLSRTIRMLKGEASNINSTVSILLKCSVFIQVYILVYGLLGNPLYDQNYLLMYCMGIIMAVVAQYSRVNESHS